MIHIRKAGQEPHRRQHTLPLSRGAAAAPAAVGSVPALTLKRAVARSLAPAPSCSLAFTLSRALDTRKNRLINPQNLIEIDEIEDKH